MKKSLRPLTCNFHWIIVVVCLICSCNTAKKYQKHFFALDTAIDITLYAGSEKTIQEIDSIESMIQRIEADLSISKKESGIFKINHRHDSLVTVSDTIKSILSICRKEYEVSHGLFDVTVEPLKTLYGLESEQTETHVPSQHELDSVMANIGFGKIHFLSDSTFIIPKNMHLDFGGIGKGYVLQEVKKTLLSKGFNTFLVNLGGDLIAIGNKPSKTPWSIGVANPRKPGSFIATVDVVDKCVFTSGDYERCFIKDGKRYHHLFDPRTGIPGSKNMSATVIGDEPLRADIAVKTAFLMPPNEALDYLASRKMIGLLVDSLGNGWASAGMKQYLHPDSTFVLTYR